MNKAIRMTVTLLGISAGGAGIEHGYFELLQGNARPDGLFIPSMGPPCDPEVVWNACEPALTILPNFLLTGILAILLGLALIIWSVGFVQRQHGGFGLILLSVALLLFGGGLFPPLIGTIAGAVATQINRPLRQRGGLFSQYLANLYPWAMAAYLTVILGQFVVGHYFNDFLAKYMGVTVILILGFLLLSILSAFAHDAQEKREAMPVLP